MKAVLGLILYLLILSVLVYNSPSLSNKVLAESEESASQEDSEDEVEEDEGSEENNGQDSTPTPTPPPPPASDLDPGLNPHDIDPEITSDTRALDPESDEQNDDRGEIAGSEANEEGKFTHNARLIAMELSELTPAEISQYPVTDLSNEDIKQVFGYLTPDNVAEVLMNIPQEDLVTIKAGLTPTYFDQILLIRLSELERAQVQDRILLVPAQNCLFC